MTMMIGPARRRVAASLASTRQPNASTTTTSPSASPRTAPTPKTSVRMASLLEGTQGAAAQLCLKYKTVRRKKGTTSRHGYSDRLLVCVCQVKARLFVGTRTNGQGVMVDFGDSSGNEESILVRELPQGVMYVCDSVKNTKHLSVG